MVTIKNSRGSIVHQQPFTRGSKPVGPSYALAAPTVHTGSSRTEQPSSCSEVFKSYL
jgi:hypothetical protein